jgi:hypothetical protein
MKLDIRQFKAPLTINDVTDEVKARNRAAETIVTDELNELNKSESEAQSQALALFTNDLKVPIALRNVDLSAITSQASLLAVLTHNLPRNEYNLPKILYRPDILDYTIFQLPPRPLDPAAPTCTSFHGGEKRDPEGTDSAQEQRFQLMQELLDASTIVLDYHEGYPSYQGSPIWSQFPWESTQDYDMFRTYLNLPGARQLSLIGIDARQMASELFHVNYWGLRCLASDTFAVVHYKRMRERRILQTDDTHFLEAERILRLLIAQIHEVQWDTLREDPKAFVEVMERVAKIQRAALGTTERRADDERTIPSVELIMRKSAEHLAPLSQNEDVGGVDIAKLLRDPKSVQDAQELILRIGGQSKE